MNGEAVWLLYLLFLLDFLLEQGSALMAYHRQFREPSRTWPSVALAAPIDRVPSTLDLERSSTTRTPGFPGL